LRSRPVDVSGRYRRAVDDDLASLSGFDRCPVLVDDRHVGAEDGSTDGAEPSFRLSGGVAVVICEADSVIP